MEGQAGGSLSRYGSSYQNFKSAGGQRQETSQNSSAQFLTGKGEKDQRCIMLLLYVRVFSYTLKIRGFLILQVRKLRFHIAEFLVGSHTNLNK